jgi:two-component sensor histidine kinase
VKPWRIVEPSLKIASGSLQGFGVVHFRKPRDDVKGLVLALLFFCAALGTRYLLDRVLPGLPYLTFFTAVLLTAYYCSLPMALAVAALSAIIGTAWIEHPAPSVRFLAGVVFSFSAVAIAWTVHSLRRQYQITKRREEQLELINRELGHRLSNLFALTSSVCIQTVRRSFPPGVALEGAVTSIEQRIKALAKAQNLLAINANAGANVDALIDALARPLAPTADRLSVAGSAVTLPAAVSTPFALVLHELATNAVKHGAWSGDAGRVTITWAEGNGQLIWTWRELDGPTPCGPHREGLGSALIRRALGESSVKYEILPDGVECTILVKVHARAGAV